MGQMRREKTATAKRVLRRVLSADRWVSRCRNDVRRHGNDERSPSEEAAHGAYRNARSSEYRDDTEAEATAHAGDADVHARAALVLAVAAFDHGHQLRAVV